MRDLMKIIDEAVNIIDNKDGVGNVPDNQSVDYKGLRVLMRPSTFLKLTPDLDRPMKTFDFVQDHLKKGGKIASPFLIVRIPPDWDDADYTEFAAIRGHEGRHRMMAVQAVFGDDPIEVHLFLADGLRARHIKPEWVKSMQKHMFREKSRVVVNGPLFEV